MKVYLDFNHSSFGLGRIAYALARHAPADIEIMPDDHKVDMIVFFAIGRHDHLLKKVRGKKYAVIQIALASTRNPDPIDWIEIWQGAKLVWSYYDLPIGNYYHAPLGADPAVFYLENYEKEFVILTTGDGYRDEPIEEVWLAADMCHRKIIHPYHATDDEMRRFYNQSKYVSGLRKRDGFEMPVVEGLLCGARPIVFDAPRYHQWFDGLAEFIPEDEETVNHLSRLFEGLYRSVTEDEIKETKRRFNWETIVKGFWERCM